jgi:hypothetical protein
MPGRCSASSCATLATAGVLAGPAAARLVGLNVQSGCGKLCPEQSVLARDHGRTVTDTYSPEAWLRLGRMLERRRGELGYGFRQRARFARERGSGKISVKTISRLEKGERAYYPQSTLGAVETMYQWAPGSVESVLLGGEPNAFLIGPQAEMNPITTEYAPPTSGERLASWMFVRMRQRGYSDDVIHAFLAAEGLPREPTTVSAVKRIADATGATVAEVLALLGVEDMSARRTPQTVAPEESGDGAAGAAPSSEGALGPITAAQRGRW